MHRDLTSKELSGTPLPPALYREPLSELRALALACGEGHPPNSPPSISFIWAAEGPELQWGL